MQNLVSLLQDYTRQIVTDCEVIAENHRARNAMGSDIVQAVESRGHVEFSLFAPNGRQQ
jgi:hypothetical protein